jgi:hypothetical protein
MFGGNIWTVREAAAQERINCPLLDFDCWKSCAMVINAIAMRSEEGFARGLYRRPVEAVGVLSYSGEGRVAS